MYPVIAHSFVDCMLKQLRDSMIGLRSHARFDGIVW